MEASPQRIPRPLLPGRPVRRAGRAPHLGPTAATAVCSPALTPPPLFPRAAAQGGAGPVATSRSFWVVFFEIADCLFAFAPWSAHVLLATMRMLFAVIPAQGWVREVVGGAGRKLA